MKNSLFLLRLKLIFFNRETCIVLVASILTCTFIINSFALAAEIRSSIPIGIINLDDSESSKELVLNLKKVPSFFVYEESEEKLFSLLNDERISAIFVIREGFEKSIRSGRLNEIVTMHYLEGNEGSKILSDIFAGEMLFKICMYKSLNLYQSLKGEVANKENAPLITFISEEDYIDYINQISSETDFDFAFDILLQGKDASANNENINAKNINDQNNKSLQNQILYMQFIWGIVGMILSFLAMFLASNLIREKEAGLTKRVSISLLRKDTILLKQIAAMMTVLIPVSAILCFFVSNRMEKYKFSQNIQLFVLMILYSFVISLWFILIVNLVRKVSNYQFFGTLSVLIFGFLSIISRFSGFINLDLLDFSEFIPNSLLLMGFTDIILAGEVLVNISHYGKLMMIGLSLLIVNMFLMNGMPKFYRSIKKGMEIN